MPLTELTLYASVTLPAGEQTLLARSRELHFAPV
jgi:hypothetical protein